MCPFRQIAGRIALAVGVPFVLLAMVEMLWRGLDLGYPTTFLLNATVRGQPALVDNPFYGYRFFSPSLARNPAPILTWPDKAPGVRRIVVLGESAAQGDPLMEFGLPRMLEGLLNEAAATGRFEVINAAVTAINSTIITDIAKQTAACRPDVYVLYIGNNEVIGPYGPGTVFTPWPGLIRLAPFRVWLTRFRLSFALREALSALGGSGRRTAGWGGLAMFSERPVALGSPGLETMYNLYERNLRSIIRTARGAGAQVILCTVAVNLADCPPFGGEEAKSEYERARQAQANDQPDAAAVTFRKARDLDTSRFRADSVLNERVRQLAAEEQAPLADTEEALAALAGGAPGRELFADHVHFTFRGAQAVARVISEAVAPLYPEAFSSSVWPDEEALKQRLLYTPWSELQMALIMADRRGHPPFTGQPHNEEQREDLTRRAEQMSRVIQSADLEALGRRYQTLREAHPADFFLPFQWGAILCDRGRWEEAAAVMRPALESVPYHFEARKLPALALCRSGRVGEAADVLLGPAAHRGAFVAEYGLEIMGLLMQQGHRDLAMKLGQRLLEKDPRLPWRERIQAAMAAIPAMTP